MLDWHLKSLDLCYFEVTEVFNGLEDEHVWRRPGNALLSIGEISGHVAYWEAVRFAGAGQGAGSARDLSDCKIQSPLLDRKFEYYTRAIEASPAQEHVTMTGERVLNELLRVHRESMASLQELNPDLASPAPHWSPSSNYDELLRYVAFHVSYHTGQMYSARHLLGERPPDN